MDPVAQAFASFGEELAFCSDLPDVDDLMFTADLEAFLAGSSCSTDMVQAPPPMPSARQSAPSSPPAPCASPPLPPLAAAPPAAPAPKAAPASSSAPLMAFAPALRLITTQGQADAAASSGSLNLAQGTASASFPAALALSLAALRPRAQPSSEEPMSDDSEDTMDDNTSNGSKPNKRKAPDVDWRSIEDPAERRRQRRLAKNRVTAARSRERKKVQWSEMEVKMNAIQSDNVQLRSLLEQVLRENSALKEQVLRLSRSASSTASGQQGKDTKAAPESAALAILIATMLCALLFLPSDKAVMLGSAVPLLLAALLMAQQGHTQGLSSLLVRFLAASRTMLRRTQLRKYWSALLYKRHALVGRATLRSLSKHAAQAEQDGSASLIPHEPLTHIKMEQPMEWLSSTPMLAAPFDQPFMPFPSAWGPAPLGMGMGMVGLAQLGGL